MAESEEFTNPVFNAANKNFILINTAYPPDKSNWACYKAAPEYDTWSREQGLGLYIHIPFCKTKCNFCEYVTMQIPAAEIIDKYIDTLLLELAIYKGKIDFSQKTLYGFDAGGGTPTILSITQLEKLFSGIKPFIDSLEHTPDYEQAIETNAEIACYNLPLLQLLTAYGFDRISMGIQTFNQKLLKDMNREYQANVQYEKSMENFYKAGFKKVNLDLMYGLPAQNLKSWEETLKLATSLKPGQISIYETRYKDSMLMHRKNHLSLNLLIQMYELAYDYLTASGYNAYYGSTAFSKDTGDGGLSSYLRKRTNEFIPYIGLGIGSQAMTREHLSYNFGKNSFDLKEYITHVEQEQPIEYYYKLPLEEILAKYIAISFYLGYIAYAKLNSRMGIDFLSFYKQAIDFLIQYELINITDSLITLTRKGYKVYHGIIALFYSPGIQKYLCQI